MISDNLASQVPVQAHSVNAPNAAQMSYQEYQKLQQMKIEMNGGATLPKHIPMDMNPLIPPPTPVDPRAAKANPFPDLDATAHNQRTDEDFEEEQRREKARQEAILAGKRRFKEIRTTLGMDLGNYKNPNMTFL